MNYFVSGLYGNYELYKEIKALATQKIDHIWILGDIFDGNSNRPEDSLKIALDIERSSNVSLVLGDHEYFHIMRNFQSGDPETAKMWEDTLVSMDISGESLLEYMDSTDGDKVFEIMHYLSQECNASEMVQIGDRKFYLCHGAPALRSNSNGGDIAWQFGVVSTSLEMEHKYLAEIASDIRIQQFADVFGGIDIKKTFIISGGTSVEYGLSTGGKDVDGIAFCKRKFCIGQDSTADNPADKFKVLAIDSAGFYTIEL